jgi:NADH:ubiquinone oxidoreductase subunit D
MSEDKGDKFNSEVEKRLSMGDTVMKIPYKGKNIEIVETVKGEFYATIHNEFIGDPYKHKTDAAHEAYIYVDNLKKSQK